MCNGDHNPNYYCYNYSDLKQNVKAYSKKPFLYFTPIKDKYSKISWSKAHHLCSSANTSLPMPNSRADLILLLNLWYICQLILQSKMECFLDLLFRVRWEFFCDVADSCVGCLFNVSWGKQVLLTCSPFFVECRECFGTVVVGKSVFLQEVCVTTRTCCVKTQNLCAKKLKSCHFIPFYLTSTNAILNLTRMAAMSQRHREVIWSVTTNQGVIFFVISRTWSDKVSPSLKVFSSSEVEDPIDIRPVLFTNWTISHWYLTDLTFTPATFLAQIKLAFLLYTVFVDAKLPWLNNLTTWTLFVPTIQTLCPSRDRLSDGKTIQNGI